MQRRRTLRVTALLVPIVLSACGRPSARDVAASADACGLADPVTAGRIVVPASGPPRVTDGREVAGPCAPSSRTAASGGTNAALTHAAEGFRDARTIAREAQANAVETQSRARNAGLSVPAIPRSQ